MFDDELLATFEAVDPAAANQTVTIQVLVDAKLISSMQGQPQRGHPVRGLLRVEVVRPLDQWAIVALPQPGIPVGDTAIVPNEGLVRAC
jgi:hypothetical protein